MNTLSTRLKEALEKRSLSQSGLEAAAKLSRGYTSRLIKGERGLRLNPEVLRRIADALEVSYEWLATGRGTMDAPSAPATTGYDTLDAAVAYHRDRWTGATIAAARAMAGEGRGAHSPQQWTEVLDRIQKALSTVEITPPPASGAEPAFTPVVAEPSEPFGDTRRAIRSVEDAAKARPQPQKRVR